MLDLGCGSGHPIAADLIGRGLAVTGVDFAPAMLAIALESLPGGTWIEADLREAAFAPGGFAAVIAWDSQFHLTRDEQRDLIGRVGRWLAPGGRYLFTCGPRDSEGWGRVDAGPVWHASLSLAGYASALEAAGLRVVRFAAEEAESHGHTVLLAVKDGAAG